MDNSVAMKLSESFFVNRKARRDEILDVTTESEGRRCILPLAAPVASWSTKEKSYGFLLISGVISGVCIIWNRLPTEQYSSIRNLSFPCVLAPVDRVLSLDC